MKSIRKRFVAIILLAVMVFSDFSDEHIIGNGQ